VKNRLPQYGFDADDQEDYENWADAVFEVSFSLPDAGDVGTLVFGPPERGGPEDFSLTQTGDQQRRLVDYYNSRRN
jgi:hypothetical protein